MTSHAGVYTSMHFDGCKLDIYARATQDGDRMALHVSAGRQEITLFLTGPQLAQLTTYLRQLEEDISRRGLELAGTPDAATVEESK